MSYPSLLRFTQDNCPQGIRSVIFHRTSLLPVDGVVTTCTRRWTGRRSGTGTVLELWMPRILPDELSRTHSRRLGPLRQSCETTGRLGRSWYVLVCPPYMLTPTIKRLIARNIDDRTSMDSFFDGHTVSQPPNTNGLELMTGYECNDMPLERGKTVQNRSVRGS